MLIIKYRILDADNDYSFGRGQQNLTYGIFAVSQAIKTRLKLLYGEWWEDTEDGLPLFEQILGKLSTTKDLTIVDTKIKERIIGTQDVISIEEFSSTCEDRKYSFECTVNTKYGNIPINNS